MRIRLRATKTVPVFEDAEWESPAASFLACCKIEISGERERTERAAAADSCCGRSMSTNPTTAVQPSDLGSTGPMWAAEVILGHCTFLGLQERGCLSTFFTIYQFIRKYYLSSEPLWDSAREKLVCFLGLMYFLQRSWRLSWSPIVAASDAGPSGCAVCIGKWSQQ